MVQYSTRRKFVKTTLSANLVANSISVVSDSDTTDHKNRINGSVLLIPEHTIPEEFETCSNPESFLLTNLYTTMDQRLRSAKVSACGYVKQNIESSPLYGIFSMAIVGNNGLSRETIETTTLESYNKPIAKFENRSNTMTKFEQTYSWSDGEYNWRIDMIEYPLKGNLETDSTPIMTQYVRHQYLENVVLSTAVIGSPNVSPSVESLLEKYAIIHRRQFKKVMCFISD